MLGIQGVCMYLMAFKTGNYLFSEEKGDLLMDPLMVDWFNLIRKKQMYIRRESELVYM